MKAGALAHQGARLSPLVKSFDQHGKVVRTIPVHQTCGLRRGAILPEPQKEEPFHRPVHERLLEVLFQPNQSFEESEIPDLSKLFTKDELAQVIKDATSLIAKDPTLLYVPAPCRVVSDLHGQLADLMRMWGWCGAPDGSIPWVFIGDYVDRTAYGCEVVLLLYALKIKWPDNIILLRGNHEIASINAFYGFQDELIRKWGFKRGEALYAAFNDSFNYLPLAAIAVPPGYEGEPEDDTQPQHDPDSPLSHWRRPSRFVPDRYLLVHGGIGRLETLSQISAVQRPVRTGTSDAAERVMLELVWSDPAPTDEDNGLLRNKRDNYGGGIVCYGADRVRDFCERNHITAIIRGHECIQEGLELAFGGQVVTFFSAVNYGGCGDNHGCILHLALTTDDCGMPSIEVHPIRLEAKPRWSPAIFHGARFDDEGDITGAEPDQNPSYQDEKPSDQNKHQQPRRIPDRRRSRDHVDRPPQPQQPQADNGTSSSTRQGADRDGLFVTVEMSTAAISSLNITPQMTESPAKRYQRQHRSKRSHSPKISDTATEAAGMAGHGQSVAGAVPDANSEDAELGGLRQALLQLPCFQKRISKALYGTPAEVGKTPPADADDPSYAERPAPTSAAEVGRDLTLSGAGSCSSKFKHVKSSLVAVAGEARQQALHDGRLGNDDVNHTPSSEQGVTFADADKGDAGNGALDKEDHAMLDAEKSFDFGEPAERTSAWQHGDDDDDLSTVVGMDTAGTEAWTIFAAAVTGEELLLAPPASPSQPDSSSDSASGSVEATPVGPGQGTSAAMWPQDGTEEQHGAQQERYATSPDRSEGEFRWAALAQQVRPTPPRPSRDAGVFDSRS